MYKIFQIFLSILILVGTFGCGAKEYLGFGDKGFLGYGGKDRTVYTGPVYPPTSKTTVAFQPVQVGKSCRVFSEALVQLPPQLTGKDIEQAVLAEAGKRGAAQVLIGQSRQGDEKSVRFLYYGPEKEYPCAEQCGSWKTSYDFWEKQGEWVSIGYKEWGKSEVRYETPLIVQIALLQCR
jgi:hypothetical protein